MTGCVQPLWFLATCAQALLALRIVYAGWSKTYPVFLSYLIYAICKSVVLCWFEPRDMVYAYLWSAGEVGYLTLKALVAREVFVLSASRYRSNGRFGNRVFWVLFGAGLLATLATLPLDANHVSGALEIVLYAKRYLSAALAAFLIFSAAFFLYVPVPTPRNITFHRWISVTYLLGDSLAYGALVVVGKEYWAEISTATLAWSLACSIAWLVLLRQSGEEVPAAGPLSTADGDALNRRATKLQEYLRALWAMIAAR